MFFRSKFLGIVIASAALGMPSIVYAGFYCGKTLDPAFIAGTCNKANANGDNKTSFYNSSGTAIVFDCTTKKFSGLAYCNTQLTSTDAEAFEKKKAELAKQTPNRAQGGTKEEQNYTYTEDANGSCWRAAKNKSGKVIGEKEAWACEDIPKTKETDETRYAAIKAKLKADIREKDKTVDKYGRTAKQRDDLLKASAKDNSLSLKEDAAEKAYRKALNKYGLNSKEANAAKETLNNTRQARTNYSGSDQSGKIAHVIHKYDSEPGVSISTNKDIRDYKKTTRAELNKKWNTEHGKPTNLQELAERNKETNTQIKNDLAGAKEKVKQNNKNKRQAAREERKKSRNENLEGDCGRLGGFNCEISDGINEGATVMNTAADMASSMVLQNMGDKETQELAAQGGQLKQSEMLRSKAAIKEQAANNIDGITGINYGAAAGQLGTGIAHLTSKNTVHTNAASLREDWQARADAAEAAGDQDKLDVALLELEKIDQAEAAESSKQTAYGIGQIAQMAGSAAKAVTAHFTAASLREQAAAERRLAEIQENMEKQNPYNFNWAPNGAGDADTDMNVNPYEAPRQDQYAAKQETPNTDLGDGMDGGNLGLTDGNVDGGGPAGGFQYQAPPGGGGGGGLSGNGGGGVSASSGGGGDEPGAPKSAKGSGKYAAGEGKAQARRYGAGNGGSVGIGNGLSDMLKKLMGQAVDEKKARDEKGFAFEGERAPSSEDAAAVIPRNGDLFRSIHSRYQKKSQEGAIVFVKN